MSAQAFSAASYRMIKLTIEIEEVQGNTNAVNVRLKTEKVNPSTLEESYAGQVSPRVQEALTRGPDVNS